MHPTLRSQKTTLATARTQMVLPQSLQSTNIANQQQPDIVRIAALQSHTDPEAGSS